MLEIYWMLEMYWMLEIAIVSSRAMADSLCARLRLGLGAKNAVETFRSCQTQSCDQALDKAALQRSQP